MSLLDQLNQILNQNRVDDRAFDNVVQQAPQDAWGNAIAGAFRDDTATPPMAEQVAQLFGQSNATQQAGLLNQLIRSIGPAAAAAIAGGVLSKVLRPGQTEVTPEQASQITPNQVRDVVTQAGAQQPQLADQLGEFYSKHSGLIKTLGGAALLIAAARLKQNMERG